MAAWLIGGSEGRRVGWGEAARVAAPQLAQRSKGQEGEVSQGGPAVAVREAEQGAHDSGAWLRRAGIQGWRWRGAVVVGGVSVQP